MEELFSRDSFLKDNFSVTSLAPLLMRWMMHWTGRRPDTSVARLVQALFGPSYGLLCAGMGPVLFAMMLSDWGAIARPVARPEKTTLANMLADRTFFFDKALNAALKSAQQVVILGAGFDTRLFELCQGQELGLFEVDRIETQRAKRQALEKGGVNIGNVHFVAVDFTSEDWMQMLILSGFEPGKRTFFLWEGVTYYLIEADVRKGLILLDQACSDGSVIAFDFFSKRLVNSEGIVGIGMSAFNLVGEPLRFGVDVSEGVRAGLAKMMTGTRWKLGELQVVDSWVNLGSDALEKDVLGGFAIASI